MTLTETLVKKELEQQSGKIWERKVLNENGKDVIVFIAKEDDISPCFCMNKLEDALRSDKDITIVQYIRDFLSSVNTKQNIIKTQSKPKKTNILKKIKDYIEDLWIYHNEKILFIAAIFCILLIIMIYYYMMTAAIETQVNISNEIEALLNKVEEGK